MDPRRASKTPNERQRISWPYAMGLWLALVGLTLQAVAPLAHAAVMRDLRANQSPDLQVLCSIDGFRVVDWSHIENGDGPAGKPIGFHIPADGPQGRFKDTYCADGAPATLAVVEPSTVPDLIFTTAARPASVSASATDAAPPWSDCRPRAPPV